MPEGALLSFTVCDAYRYFAGQAFVNGVTKYVTSRMFSTHG